MLHDAKFNARRHEVSAVDPVQKKSICKTSLLLFNAQHCFQCSDCEKRCSSGGQKPRNEPKMEPKAWALSL